MDAISSTTATATTTTESASSALAHVLPAESCHLAASLCSDAPSAAAPCFDGAACMNGAAAASASTLLGGEGSSFVCGSNGDLEGKDASAMASSETIVKGTVESSLEKTDAMAMATTAGEEVAAHPVQFSEKCDEHVLLPPPRPEVQQDGGEDEQQHVSGADTAATIRSNSKIALVDTNDSAPFSCFPPATSDAHAHVQAHEHAHAHAHSSAHAHASAHAPNGEAIDISCMPECVLDAAHVTSSPAAIFVVSAAAAEHTSAEPLQEKQLSSALEADISVMHSLDAVAEKSVLESSAQSTPAMPSTADEKVAPSSPVKSEANVTHIADTDFSDEGSRVNSRGSGASNYETPQNSTSVHFLLNSGAVAGDAKEGTRISTSTRPRRTASSSMRTPAPKVIRREASSTPSARRSPVSKVVTEPVRKDSFELHELVWAKNPGDPYWPAMIVSIEEIPPDVTDYLCKRHDNGYFVFFFEDCAFARLTARNILPYAENLEAMKSISRRKKFVKAVDLITHSDPQAAFLAYKASREKAYRRRAMVKKDNESEIESAEESARSEQEDAVVDGVERSSDAEIKQLSRKTETPSRRRTKAQEPAAATPSSRKQVKVDGAAASSVSRKRASEKSEPATPQSAPTRASQRKAAVPATRTAQKAVPATVPQKKGKVSSGRSVPAAEIATPSVKKVSNNTASSRQTKRKRNSPEMEPLNDLVVENVKRSRPRSVKGKTESKSSVRASGKKVQKIASNDEQYPQGEETQFNQPESHNSHTIDKYDIKSILKGARFALQSNFIKDKGLSNRPRIDSFPIEKIDWSFITENLTTLYQILHNDNIDFQDLINSRIPRVLKKIAQATFSEEAEKHMAQYQIRDSVNALLAKISEIYCILEAENPAHDSQEAQADDEPISAQTQS